MAGKRIWKLICCLGLGYLLGSGCVKDNPEKPLPPALGKLNELTVVMDTLWWQEKMGTQVRQRFAAAFPFISPAEPLFNIQYYSPRRFLANPKFLAQRNCLIILRKYAADPQELALAKIIESRLSQEQLKQWRNNQVFSLDKVWADPQRVMVIAVEEEKQALACWEQYYPSIYQKIRDNEATLHQASLFRKKGDEAIRLKLWDNHQVDLEVPRGTQLLSSSDSISWLHYPYADGSSLWLLLRQTTQAEQARAAEMPTATLQGILQRSPPPLSMGQGLIRTEEKAPPLFSSSIQYQKTIPATEWRGLWQLGNKSGSLIAQLPDFPPEAPVLLAGFVESNQPNKVEKLLNLQYLLQRQRTERKP
jgi:hypothetical protein